MNEPQIPPRAPAPPQPYHAAGSAFDPRHKSPFAASVLSLLPGLGQTYVGYYQRGFAHALVAGSLIALLAADVLDDATPFAALFLVFFWLYNVVDAGRRAALFNQAVAEGERFQPVAIPADALMPGRHGSLIGGTALMAAGFVLLLHTRFDVRLDWIEDWWPAAPMVLGGYLVFMALREKRGLSEATAD
jgi:hypothetical protein